MLTALETGVKGGKWFSLVDKVWSLPNLAMAFARVRAKGGAAGCDHQTIAMFEARLKANLHFLSEQLRNETYRPQKIRRVYIPKPGSRETRPLGIPTVRDRTVQAALRQVIEPIFERDFAEQSYGFQPDRGCKDALRRVDALLKTRHRHVVDADLKGYFDTIPHQLLLERVGDKITDGRVQKLIESFLTQGVMDGSSRSAAAPGQDADRGRGPTRIRLFGLPLQTQKTLAARQKYPENQGHDMQQDATPERPEPARYHRECQSDDARMV